VICDFCSACHPAWLYPADSFLDQFKSVSQGDWLACGECHRLIEAGDRDALAARVALTPIVQSGAIDPRRARQYATTLHRGFFEHRRGEARRIAS
jgi:hypothetical protein